MCIRDRIIIHRLNSFNLQKGTANPPNLTFFSFLVTFPEKLEEEFYKLLSNIIR